MPDSVYSLDFPDDAWIWMPADGQDVAAWAQEVCQDLGAEGGLEVELAEQLRSYGVVLREKEADAGAVWVPDPRYGVLAALYTDRLVDDEGLTLERIEELERSVHLPGMAPPTVTRTELPAGPAVRTRRLEHFEGPSTDQLAETVSHVVLPEGFTAGGQPAAIRLVVTWTLLEEGEELAGLADDVAALLRAEPV